jgi:formyl-CoA transferase
MFAPYQAIACADGHITLGTANDRLFVKLCELLDHPEWPSDPDYATAALRVRHRASLIAQIEAITSMHPKQYWLDRFEREGIPCGPVNDYAQVFNDPQVLARGMVVDVEHPVLGRMKTLGSPIKMSDTPPNATRRAPLLGEHTQEVLLEAGCTEEEIAAAT